MKGRFLVAFVIVVSLLLTGTLLAMAQEQKKDEPQTEEQSEEVQLIDLNLATLEELISLQGIGEVLAQRIIDGRPYEKTEDLLEVEGIGDKRFEAIKDLVMVAPSEEGSEEGKSEETKKDELKKEEKK